MYRLTDTDIVVRIADGAWIPNYSANRDRAEYEAWLSAGNVPEPYQPMVPETIADWQFFQQLAVLGIITQDQALASNGGVIPPPLLDIIEQLPSANKFQAKMRVGGATVYHRDHWLTIAIGEAYGWTPAQIDDFFRAAAAL